MFRIPQAYPGGYSGFVTIHINFINPKDNWGEIGLKIKTYEVIDGEEYLVDKLEGDELIPNLKCDSPCKECKEDPVSKEIIQRDFCTECWSDSSFKYLMVSKEWDEATLTGESTCINTCPDGFTSNGDTELH